MPKITAILNTFNERHLLEDCLLSIRDHVDEIIVTDMGSIDGSQELAKRHGCVVIPIEWKPAVEETVNEKVLLAKSEWIFALDPDMRVPKNTWDRIQQIINEGDAEAIVFRVRNQVFGKWTDYGHGSGPNLYRLFKRERYLLNGPPTVEIHTMFPRALEGSKKVYMSREYPILHVAYSNVKDALYRASPVREFEAEHLKEHRVHSSLPASVYRVCRKIFGDFVVRSAWRGGKEGMAFSLIALIMMIRETFCSGMQRATDGSSLQPQTKRRFRLVRISIDDGTARSDNILRSFSSSAPSSL